MIEKNWLDLKKPDELELTHPSYNCIKTDIIVERVERVITVT